MGEQLATTKASGPPINAQLLKSDLRTLFAGSTDLNELSPFFGERSNGAQLSAGAEEFCKHSLFQQTLAALTRPDLHITNTVADSGSGVTVFSAYASTQTDQELIVVVYPGQNDSVYLRVCRSYQEYVLWWLTVLATEVDRPSQSSSIVKPLAIEELVCLLHSIDSQRKLHYQAALNYVEPDDGYISIADFRTSLVRALSCSNVFWLVSSLMRSMPHLKDCKINPKDENLSLMEKLDILRPGYISSEPVFKFGNKGRELGTEFREAWTTAIGVSTTIRQEDEQSVLERYFITPTARANHVFQLFPGHPGWTAQHRAMTYTELLNCLMSTVSEGMRRARGAKEKRPHAILKTVSEQDQTWGSPAAPGEPAQEPINKRITKTRKLPPPLATAPSAQQPQQAAPTQNQSPPLSVTPSKKRTTKTRRQPPPLPQGRTAADQQQTPVNQQRTARAPKGPPPLPVGLAQQNAGQQGNGKPAAVKCPYCQIVAKPGARFCTNCAKRLPVES